MPLGRQHHFTNGVSISIHCMNYLSAIWSFNQIFPLLQEEIVSSSLILVLMDKNNAVY